MPATLTQAPKATRIILHDDALRERAKLAVDLAGQSPLMEVLIRPHKRERSLEANALYWRWLTTIADSLGSSKDELHEQFKRRFLVPILIRDDSGFAEMVQAVNAVEKAQQEPLKRQIVRLVSTTGLNTKQFTEYLNEIEAHANGLGIILPTREEYAA